MKIQVLKFGGTSVATAQGRELAIGKIIASRNAGYATAIVISAMGRRGDPYATDTLLDLILEANENVTQRELDMVSGTGEIISGVVMAALLQKNGYKAMFLNSDQSGIRTNGVYREARVSRMDTKRVLSILSEGGIPLIPSGQGTTEDGELTMLGRGGGDTSATTVGVALNAESVVIYTDVNGIFSGDPRIIPEAKSISKISYASCIDMAYLGSKVIHPRAVETAQENPNVKVYIRNIFTDEEGTLICADGKRDTIIGVALQKDDTIFQGEVSADLKNRLSAMEINVYAVGVPGHFAIAQKDIKPFSGMAPDYKVADRLHKISLVGDNSAVSADKIKEKYSAAFMHKASGFLSIWVRDNPEEATRRLHNEFCSNN